VFAPNAGRLRQLGLPRWARGRGRPGGPGSQHPGRGGQQSPAVGSGT
jgi:hypothetical protein